jgi:hypothetical protein
MTLIQPRGGLYERRATSTDYKPPLLTENNRAMKNTPITIQRNRDNTINIQYMH